MVPLGLKFRWIKFDDMRSSSDSSLEENGAWRSRPQALVVDAEYQPRSGQASNELIVLLIKIFNNGRKHY